LSKYVDDFLILSCSKYTITKFISLFAFGTDEFKFTDEGELNKYLAVEIERLLLYDSTISYAMCY